MNIVAESVQRGDSTVAELVMATRPRRGRWLRRLVFLLIFGGLLFAFRHPLMSVAARLWIVDDPLEKADAAVVLGGSVDTRPFFTAELYRRELIPLVLVAKVKKSPAAQLELMPLESDISISVLRKMGVPESAIQRFGNGVTSTLDEATALRSWLESHPVKRIIIATDPFHTRRVRYIFSHELKGLPVQLSVASIPTPRYDPLHWWLSEEASVAFQNEVFKLIYYILRH